MNMVLAPTIKNISYEYGKCSSNRSRVIALTESWRQTDRRTDRWTDRRMDEWMDRQMQMTTIPFQPEGLRGKNGVKYAKCWKFDSNQVSSVWDMPRWNQKLGACSFSQARLFGKILSQNIPKTKICQKIHVTTNCPDTKVSADYTHCRPILNWKGQMLHPAVINALRPGYDMDTKAAEQ